MRVREYSSFLVCVPNRRVSPCRMRSGVVVRAPKEILSTKIKLWSMKAGIAVKIVLLGIGFAAVVFVGWVIFNSVTSFLPG